MSESLSNEKFSLIQTVFCRNMGVWAKFARYFLEGEGAVLIRFTVANYLSFHNEVELSLFPGRMRKHPEHILRSSRKSGVDVLKTALIYGANASGKSNLVRAIDFARRFILEGERPRAAIETETFRLDPDAAHQNSRFEFEFIVDDQAYAYGFELNRRQVEEEWLFQISRAGEKAIFERRTLDDGTADVSFNHHDSELQFLRFVARGTRPNQLFLTTSVDQNVPDFRHISDWFAEKLTVLFPESVLLDLESRISGIDHYDESLSRFLARMNTGIDDICFRDIDFGTIELPEPLREQILSDLPERGYLRNSDGKRFLLLRNASNELEARALNTVHRLPDGREVFFDVTEESDGTQRLFDLFPILFELSGTGRVYVVDELERSLHPNLVRRFLEIFLASGTESQLIVTTHESNLLDLSFLRRDEVWFMEKDRDGASQLHSLEEYAPRADKDIEKGYLVGRYGGIPVLRGRPLDSVEG